MAKRETLVDMTGHNGLRGMAAVWVMIFHCLLFSHYPLDILGTTLMPLFFMLSGFSLTVAYGTYAKPEKDVEMVEYAAVAKEEEKENAPQEGDSPEGTPSPTSYGTLTLSPSPDDSAPLGQASPASAAEKEGLEVVKFHRNRFARVFPVYYVCNLLALPYWFTGYGAYSPMSWYFPASIVTTIVPVSTLLFNAVGNCLDGPAWTVATLSMLWLAFPSLLRHVQRRSDQDLVRSLCNCYWYQLLFLFVVFFVGTPLVGWWIAFSVATYWPPGRTPLFLMGMYAGEMCVRSRGRLYPWQPGCLALFPPMFCCWQGTCIFPVNTSALYSAPLDRDEQEKEEKKWGEVLDNRSLYIALLTLFVSLLDALQRHLKGGEGILGMVWLQAIVPYLQLQIIVACTRDGARSKASSLLRQGWAQWLGELSACLYLIHYVVLRYFAWALHGGSIHFPRRFYCSHSEGEKAHDACEREVEEYLSAINIPLWATPLVVVTSLCCAAALYYGVEEPMRKMLRK